MSAVRITGMSLSTDQPSRNWKTVAFFDVEVGGLVLYGCALARCKNGLIVSPPKVDKDGPRRGVRFADLSLRDQITDAALRAYRGLGGSEEDLTAEEPSR